MPTSALIIPPGEDSVRRHLYNFTMGNIVLHQVSTLGRCTIDRRKERLSFMQLSEKTHVIVPYYSVPGENIDKQNRSDPLATCRIDRY